MGSPTGIDYGGRLLIPEVHSIKTKNLYRPRTDKELREWIDIDPKNDRFTSHAGRDLFYRCADDDISKCPVMNVETNRTWVYIGNDYAHDAIRILGSFVFTLLICTSDVAFQKLCPYKASQQELQSSQE